MNKQRNTTYIRKAVLNAAFLAAARREDFVAVTCALLDALVRIRETTRGMRSPQCEDVPGGAR
jgi:hypothetical protein